MTQLERAAKALSDNHLMVSDGHYTAAARAVLLAIREPSDAMIDAANDSISDEYECGLAWREMIDAALGE